MQHFGSESIRDLSLSGLQNKNKNNWSNPNAQIRIFEILSLEINTEIKIM